MSTGAEERGQKNRGEVDWDDPSIAAGNSPPLPGWPLWVTAMMWGGWVIVLAVIAFVS